MDYSEVLSTAGRITWRNKGLWVLGILASCGRGGGGGGGGGNAGIRGDAESFENLPGGLGDVGRFMESIPEELIITVAIVLICLALIAAFVFFVLGTIGQAGLVAGFNQADTGEAVSLASAFQAGRGYFWRILGLQVLVVAIVIAIALGLAAIFAVVGIATFGVGMIFLFPLICVIIPLAIAAGIYVTLVKVAIVVEDLRVMDSFGRAWEVARSNVGPVVVMGLILLIGGGLVSFIVSLPVFLVAIPLVGGFLVGTDESVVTGLGLAALCFVLYLPVLITLQGIVTTYVDGAWTLTYRRITGREGAPLPGAAPA